MSDQISRRHLFLAAAGAGALGAAGCKSTSERGVEESARIAGFGQAQRRAYRLVIDRLIELHAHQANDKLSRATLKTQIDAMVDVALNPAAPGQGHPHEAAWLKLESECLNAAVTWNELLSLEAPQPFPPPIEVQVAGHTLTAAQAKEMKQAVDSVQHADFEP